MLPLCAPPCGRAGGSAVVKLGDDGAVDGGGDELLLGGEAAFSDHLVHVIFYRTLLDEQLFCNGCIGVAVDIKPQNVLLHIRQVV